MREKRIEFYATYIIIPILAGIVFAYLITGFMDYYIPACALQNRLNQSKRLTTESKTNNIDLVIIKNDVFHIDKGILTTVKKRKAIKVVSSINGYKLVGFVSGSNPMALFKKYGKPVVIVTKKKGIDNIWTLDRITKDGVYLKNKVTKEEKKFKFPVNRTNISIFGKNVSVKYANSTEENSPIEKIKVSKNIVKQVSNINSLLSQINIVPAFKQGKAFGYKINYIAPNSVLRKIGLKTGDIIVSINGEPTTSPDKIMNLYSQLNDMTSVNLNIIRNGKRKTIFIEIE